MEFMTSMNYPLSDIDNVHFKKFVSRNLPYPIYSSSHYRKVVMPDLYGLKMRKLKKYLLIKAST